ncbi:hypothetical protein FRB90_011216 [Tulasnella sp. 427]|nr:hypothetical protein FRB90_011216 [Tulasnella sp. 427]
MSQNIGRLYSSASEIKGYQKLNQRDQEMLDELIQRNRRTPAGETEVVNSWVRDTNSANASRARPDSDRGSTDFGESKPERRSSWLSQSQSQSHSASSGNPRSSVPPALGLDLNSDGTTTVGARQPSSASNGTIESTHQPPSSTAVDLSIYKGNIEIALAKIELAKTQVKQEVAKRVLLERQIALRKLRRSLQRRESRKKEPASKGAEVFQGPVEDTEYNGHVDAQAQTENEGARDSELDELEDDEDELLLADCDISIANAEIRVGEAEVLWQEAKLTLLQHKAIPAGEIQFGVFYLNGGDEQLTWRHLHCVNSTQMKNIAKVYPFGKGIVDYDTLREDDQEKIKNYFEQYTGPLNSFQDALRAQGRKYSFAEESELQAAPSERSKSPPAEETEGVGPSWGAEPRSPSQASAAPPLSATSSGAPPRYHQTYSGRYRPQQTLETGSANLSRQERDDLTISQLGLSLVDLDIATARMDHAASVVDVEKAKQKRFEWELGRLQGRIQANGPSSQLQEQIESLELQVIQAELRVAEAQSKLAEARIQKEVAKRAVIALQLTEGGK